MQNILYKIPTQRSRYKVPEQSTQLLRAFKIFDFTGAVKIEDFKRLLRTGCSIPNVWLRYKKYQIENLVKW